MYLGGFKNGKPDVAEITEESDRSKHSDAALKQYLTNKKKLRD